jgi:hypothetical protein
MEPTALVAGTVRASSVSRARAPLHRKRFAI